MARFKIETPYTLIELRAFVLTQEPKSIQMNRSQIDWYKSIVRQRTDRPLKYRGIPVKLYEHR